MVMKCKSKSDKNFEINVILTLIDIENRPQVYTDAISELVQSA